MKLARKVVKRTFLRASGLAARLPDRTPCYWFNDWRNFGDQIAPAILSELFDIRPQGVHRRFSGKVLSTGSVLHELRPGDVVWGSGSMRDAYVDGRDATFLAVRGPRTRKLIRGDVPEVYGDPGLLLPEIYTPRVWRRFAAGLIPHAFDRGVMRSDDPEILNIDVTAGHCWRCVIDSIAACEVIVSSSLHGIVAAEAYGIPAVWVEPSDRVVGGGFKFADYYESTGRDAVPAPWGDGLRSVVAKAQRPLRFDTRPLVEAWVKYWDHAHL